MPDLSLLKFEADVAAFARLVRLNQAEVMRKIASDIWTRIVGNFQSHRHPVDTGRARAAWGLTFAPSIPTLPPGVYPPPPEPNWAPITGTEIAYILNSVEYIEALEDGHSKQAPNGMVRLAILEVESEIEAILQINP